MIRLLVITAVNTLAVLAVSGPICQSLPAAAFWPIAVIVLLSSISPIILRMRPTWQLINSVVPVTVYLSATANLSTVAPLFLIALIVLALIHLPTLWTGVPFYPTSKAMYAAVNSELPKDSVFRFGDLGSGYGTMLFELAKKHPNAKFVGYEISLWPYLFSRIKALRYHNVQIIFRSFWEITLNEFDFVYSFLAPAPMPRLWDKAKKEMRSGSVFMTNTFKVEAKPDRTVAVSDERNCVLYIHHIK